MRQQNAGAVLHIIRELGPISRPDIAREAGLSKPTVSNVVKFLSERGYLVEEEMAPTAGEPKSRGPRPRLVSFNARTGYVIGIDTGADNTIGKLSDLAGNVLATHRRKHDAHPDRHRVLADIRQVIADLLRTSGLQASDISALGLGTPGVVDPDTGCVSLAPQISGWEGTNLSQEFADQFTCPVVIENETHLSLLAERWEGSAQECRNALLVQLGIGVGGAFLLDGKIYRGSTGAAGEIAYLSLSDGDEQPPADSSIGAFEWYVGGQAYRRHGMRAARSEDGQRLLELGHGDPAAVTARTVFRAAREGDPAATKVMQLLLERLARGISNLATAMNPELVIIGGGVSKAGEFILPTIQEVVDDMVPHSPTVVLSSLGDRGTVIGALHRALDVVNQEIYTTFTYRPS